jgi:hypothetical protein
MQNSRQIYPKGQADPANRRSGLTSVRISGVLLILMFVFSDSYVEGKRFLHRVIATISRLQSALNFWIDGIFIC